jgi:Zn finger protein HypA/HybF involved in hydrogenase expression
MSNKRTDYPFMNEIREDYRILIKDGKIGSKEKIPFICNIHGEYWQQLKGHNNGSGCPKCADIKRQIIRRKKDYPFMEEIREDYRVKIQNGMISINDKVPFICNIHGEYWQSLNNHFSKNHGCSECGDIQRQISSRKKDYLFIAEIRKDYQLLIIEGKIKQKDKIPFICKKHGEYWQQLRGHNNGSGCPKCADIKRQIIRRKKDYPFMEEIRSDYQEKIRNSEILSTDKIPFICKEHGEYWQELNSHNRGYNCPKCGVNKYTITRRRKDYPFMDEIRFDYQEKIINGELSALEKVPFICDVHGEYWQSLNNHFSKNYGCPKCANIISKSEVEVYNFVKEYYPNTKHNIRTLIPNKKIELDIYIPELKIGIEYDGLIWHSTRFNNDKYNLYNKTKLFNNMGIHLIHIL